MNVLNLSNSHRARFNTDSNKTSSSHGLLLGLEKVFCDFQFGFTFNFLYREPGKGFGNSSTVLTLNGAGPVNATIILGLPKFYDLLLVSKFFQASVPYEGKTDKHK